MCRLAWIALFVSTFAGAAHAGVPVLSGYPSCSYDRLGNVRATDGRRPDGSPDDGRLRLASYPRVFDRLSAQGETLGANAIVANTHEAAFYTKSGKRTPLPVYVSVSGGAIRIAEPGKCRIDVMNADVMQNRALHGDVEQINLDQPPTMVK